MLQATVARPLRVYTSKLKAPRLHLEARAQRGGAGRRRKPLVPTILLFGLALFLIAQVVLGA
jgi:hypothetical protein